MKLVAVTSGKGGTGKSCVAAYTGAALAQAGFKTLMVEQGRDPRTLDIILGAQGDAVFDIGDIFSGLCMPEKAVVQAKLHRNLFLIPASIRQYRPTGPGQFGKLLHLLKPDYDYILVDGVDFLAAPPALFDLVLLVTTPDSLSIRSSENQARLLYEAKVKELRMVINNVPARVLPIQGIQDFDDIIDRVGVQLMGVVPASPKLQYSSNNAKLLDHESITAQVFENLAGRLMGQGRPLLIR